MSLRARLRGRPSLASEHTPLAIIFTTVFSKLATLMLSPDSSPSPARKRRLRGDVVRSAAAPIAAIDAPTSLETLSASSISLFASRLCCICNEDLSALSIMAAQVHINQCLDGPATTAYPPPTASDGIEARTAAAAALQSGAAQAAVASVAATSATAAAAAARPFAGRAPRSVNQEELLLARALSASLAAPPAAPAAAPRRSRAAAAAAGSGSGGGSGRRGGRGRGRSSGRTQSSERGSSAGDQSADINTSLLAGVQLLLRQGCMQA